MKETKKQTPRDEAIEIMGVYGFEKGKNMICREMFTSGDFSYWRDVNTEFFKFNEELEIPIKKRNPFDSIKKLLKK